jgi:hypothetical protein
MNFTNWQIIPWQVNLALSRVPVDLAEDGTTVVRALLMALAPPPVGLVTDTP